MKMMNIGIVLLHSTANRKALRVANGVRSVLKDTGHKYYGATIEVINVEKFTKYPEKWKERVNNQDGYIFISETFSDELVEENSKWLDSVKDEIQDKAASVISFGKKELESKTINNMTLLLKNYFSLIFTEQVFMSEEELSGWTFDEREEEYIEDWLDQFAMLILGMKYVRNLKSRLVV